MPYSPQQIREVWKSVVRGQRKKNRNIEIAEAFRYWPLSHEVGEYIKEDAEFLKRDKTPFIPLFVLLGHKWIKARIDVIEETVDQIKIHTPKDPSRLYYEEFLHWLRVAGAEILSRNHPVFQGIAARDNWTWYLQNGMQYYIEEGLFFLDPTSLRSALLDELAYRGFQKGGTNNPAFISQVEQDTWLILDNYKNPRTGNAGEILEYLVFLVGQERYYIEVTQNSHLLRGLSMSLWALNYMTSPFRHSILIWLLGSPERIVAWATSLGANAKGESITLHYVPRFKKVQFELVGDRIEQIKAYDLWRDIYHDL